MWGGLSPELQRDVAVVKLPMVSPEENALMVNALQRCSSIVAQNSPQEGFGLTVTEAMWKGRPVLGTRAAGIHAQVTDGEHGRLVSNPENPEEIAATLGGMLEDESSCRVWGRNARPRRRALPDPRAGAPLAGADLKRVLRRVHPRPRRRSDGSDSSVSAHGNSGV